MSNWYPQAVVRPGPSVKVQQGRNPGKGVVGHSMVGYRYGAHSVLDNTVGHRATVAWPFSVLQDGTVEQHYPLDAILHHAGNSWANANLIGIEHEGGYEPEDEPLTPIQLAASVSLVKWIAAQRGWEPRRVGGTTLYEHHEVSDTSTKCPSGRIPWEAYLVTTAYTDEQQQMLDWLNNEPLGQAQSRSERKRLLASVGLTDTAIPKPPETPQEPAGDSELLIHVENIERAAAAIRAALRRKA